MSRYINGLSIVLLATLSVVSLSSKAGILFQDGFESGSRSAASNGFYWSDNTPNTKPTTTRALTGQYSLEFPFQPKPAGQDSFEEQRVKFGKAYTELWVKYDLYVPSNYYHRVDGASNNKFFAIFNNNYRPGFQLNFSTDPLSNGESKLVLHYYRNGVEMAPIGSGAGPIIGSADRGKWHRIVMHFKVPSGTSSADGIAELWKNGQQMFSVKNLASNASSGMNYMDEAYLLGWANSGYSELTVMNIDNVEIADTPISPDGGGTTTPTASPPLAPSLRITQ